MNGCNGDLGNQADEPVSHIVETRTPEIGCVSGWSPPAPHWDQRYDGSVLPGFHQASAQTRLILQQQGGGAPTGSGAPVSLPTGSHDLQHKAKLQITKQTRATNFMMIAT